MYQMSLKVEEVRIIPLFILCHTWLLGVQVTKFYSVIVAPFVRLFREFFHLVRAKFSLSLAFYLSLSLKLSSR